MSLDQAILCAKILIVDDQEANVRLLTRLLNEAGYSRVTSTMAPTEVCALDRLHGYDLVLLDMQMPGLDGFGVLKALHEVERSRYLPVIVLTAQPGHKLRALQAGAKDFISKPFDLVEVKARIHNILEVRMLYAELEGHNRLLQHAVVERTTELKSLTGYLITAREDEKAHLARELHDEMGAMLTAARFEMVRLRGKLPAEPSVAVCFEQLKRHLDACIELKRRIIEDLRPSSLALFGLRISLANLCAEVGARLSIAIQIDLDEVSLTDEGHLAIYRLVQEALNNVCKYAQATRVSVSVKSEPTLVRVQIEDDGIGFDATQAAFGSHGIAGMRFRMERLNGSMSVDSCPGAGTRLEAIVPLPGAAAALA